MEFFNFSFPFSIRAESRANAFLPFIFSLSFYSIPPGEHNLNTCKYKYHNAIITQIKKKKKKFEVSSPMNETKRFEPKPERETNDSSIEDHAEGMKPSRHTKLQSH